MEYFHTSVVVLAYVFLAYLRKNYLEIFDFFELKIKLFKHLWINNTHTLGRDNIANYCLRIKQYQPSKKKEKKKKKPYSTSWRRYVLWKVTVHQVALLCGK